jgi:hypothetical protein
MAAPFQMLFCQTSVKTDSLLHSHHYRTDFVAPVVFLITSLRGLNRKHISNSICVYACLSIAMGMCLPSCCLETNVVTELFASSGCFSGSTVLLLSKCATIHYFFCQNSVIMKLFSLSSSSCFVSKSESDDLTFINTNSQELPLSCSFCK